MHLNELQSRAEAAITQAENFRLENRNLRSSNENLVTSKVRQAPGPGVPICALRATYCTSGLRFNFCFGPLGCVTGHGFVREDFVKCMYALFRAGGFHVWSFM